MTDEIDQDVREAAEAFKRNALVLLMVLAHQDGEEAEYNSNYLDQMFAQAFARMKAAGREQGLREAAEVARGKAESVREKARRDQKITDGRGGLVLGYEDAAAAITALMEGEGK